MNNEKSLQALLCAGPLTTTAQFGLKAGLNFTDISRASAINNR
jgi:hypothetical protein